MENRSYQVLRRKSDFEKLFTSGRRIYPSSWMTLNVTSNESLFLRCGWTIPKKVGNAVIRNRLKRWCRLYFREKAPFAGHLDLNVVFRSVSQPKDFYRRMLHEDFVTCMDRGWRKAQGIGEAKTAKSSTPSSN